LTIIPLPYCWAMSQTQRNLLPVIVPLREIYHHHCRILQSSERLQDFPPDANAHQWRRTTTTRNPQRTCWWRDSTARRCRFLSRARSGSILAFASLSYYCSTYRQALDHARTYVTLTTVGVTLFRIRPAVKSVCLTHKPLFITDDHDVLLSRE